MAKHSQAHLPRKLKKSLGGLPVSVKEQMEYYMGAKLLEIGVSPKAAIYRWSKKDDGPEHVTWTYSAYWADSKEQRLAEEQAKKG